MKVAALRIGGEAARWRELGFGVTDAGVSVLGEIRVELHRSAEPGAIESWALDGEAVPDSIDGLPTDDALRGGAEHDHANGAIGIDHVVVFTPSLERTTAAFAEVDVDCRRVREAGGGVQQGFFLVGDLLVEVIEGVGLEEDAPARFWGLTAVVADLDRAATVLGDRLGAIKDAVQPGRRIATVRPRRRGRSAARPDHPARVTLRSPTSSRRAGRWPARSRRRADPRRGRCLLGCRSSALRRVWTPWAEREVPRKNWSCGIDIRLALLR